MYHSPIAMVSHRQSAHRVLGLFMAGVAAHRFPRFFAFLGASRAHKVAISSSVKQERNASARS
jgi:hypothetical protein